LPLPVAGLDIALADLVKRLIQLHMFPEYQGVLIAPEDEKHLVHPIYGGVIGIPVALGDQIEAPKAKYGEVKIKPFGQGDLVAVKDGIGQDGEGSCRNPCICASVSRWRYIQISEYPVSRSGGTRPRQMN